MLSKPSYRQKSLKHEFKTIVPSHQKRITKRTIAVSSHTNALESLAKEVGIHKLGDWSARSRALEQLGARLGVKQLDDWYSVDRRLVKRELSSITKESLRSMLMEVYPHHNWDPKQFSKRESNWNDMNTQRDALEKLGIQLGVKELDDWYHVDSKTVRNELKFIKRYYNDSLHSALKTLYPQHNWNPLKFSKVPQGYWKNTDAQRSALESLGTRLGVKELDDWYHVDATAVRGELSFIRNYYDSLYSALKTLYPHHNWNPLKFSKVPQGYWSDISTQKDALEKLGTQLGVKELDDWYYVDANTVKRKLSFIRSYYDSLYSALKTLYPHHDWNPLKFSRVPRGYWRDINAQRDALEKIGTQLGVKELDDWYTIDSRAVKSELSFIGDYYSDSLYGALKELYPHHNWDPLKFSKAPQGYWSDINTQRSAIEMLGTQLGVKELDDWYNVDSNTVRNKLSFIRNYYDSLYSALKTLYPQHNWDPLKFSHLPRGYWQKASTIKQFRALFVKWKKQHNIQRLKDWYQLPPEQLKLFQRASHGIFGTVTKMLQTWFPATNWIDEVHGSNPERQLQMMLRLVTGDVKLHHRIGKHSVDMYIPEWNVAVEYQGIQHYRQHWRGDFNSQRQRDEDKPGYLLGQENPVALVPISYRWNGTWAQLRSAFKAVQSMFGKKEQSTDSSSSEVIADKKEKRKKESNEDNSDSGKKSGGNILDYLADPSWKKALKSEFKKPYFKEILTFLEKEKKAGKKIFPPENEIFTAFNLTPLDRVKVVILGQDPYHGDGQAHGLCFSVKKGVPTPPSLRNIYTELSNDIPGFKIPNHGNLEKWAKEGVFMLNATLTVEARNPNSHSEIGWQEFTDAVIKIINEKCDKVVFILWGAFAQRKGRIIDTQKHFVIAAAHPSPYSADYFWGCKAFSKTNKYLKANGKTPIDWKLPFD